MKLTTYIEQLLHKHNCVIVPDFGGFIANYRPAVIDQNKGRILPPSKGVLFNPNLVNNDGLLGNAVAKGQDIAYPAAMDFIAEHVANWRSDLNEGKRIEVGEIGFLFTENGQVIFEQNREVNVLLNAYGLSGVSFVNFAEKKKEAAKVAEVKEMPKALENKPVIQTEKEAVVIELNTDSSKADFGIEEVVAEEEQDEKVIPIQRRKGNAFKYVAVAAAVPLLFYAYWIPMETDFMNTGQIQIADFNPIHNSPERVYEVRESKFEAIAIDDVKSWEELTGTISDHVSVYNYQFDDELYIPIQLEKAVETNNVVVSSDVNKSSNNLPYHIIGGCFSVKANAEQLVNDLNQQGYSASVLDYNGGLYRVTAGDYEKRSEAKSALEGFKNSGFSGWILKK